MTSNNTFVAKHAIANLFNSNGRGVWLTNDEVYDRINFRARASFKTVQNVTSGLKLYGGLRSRRVGNILEYQRISKPAISFAAQEIF